MYIEDLRGTEEGDNTTQGGQHKETWLTGIKKWIGLKLAEAMGEVKDREGGKRESRPLNVPAINEMP